MESSKKKGSKGKKELAEQEKKIIELAKVAWGKALAEFYFPPLDMPRYVFDYTKIEGYYIDPDHKWQITMNLANTPLFREDMEYTKFFHAISQRPKDR